MSEKEMINTINQAQIIEPDSVRKGIKENAIQFEFAKSKRNDDSSNNVEFLVVANIRLNPKYLQHFMATIVEAGIEYERNFNVDIGFAPFWRSENTWGGFLC